ncbi:MAG TPA: hypothetical protein VGF76_16130 [Polyangiaceae bacterium]|jgi:hypothetical protein
MTQTARIVPHLRSQRYALGVLCASLLLSVASKGRAEDAPENVAAARTLGIEGVQLADAGKCPEAIEKLQRAESLHHAPTILDRLGECQVSVGELVEGTENLNAVVREPLAANAPKVFHDAQDRAQKVLASATPRIAHLVIRVTPAEAKASVAVGGKAVPDALIGSERPTDPGTHEVTATAAGYKPASTTVTLAEGGHQDITLLLERDPNAVAVVPPTSTTPAVQTGAPVSPPEPAAAHSNTAAYVLLGVGGAGLIVGGITGALAFGKASDCPNKVCKTQSDLDSAKSMATVSTVTFGVGIVGVAVGTILLLTGNHQSEAPPAQALSRPAPKLAVQPWFGLNSAGLMGSFE